MLNDWTVDELLKLLKLSNAIFLHPELLPGNQDNEIGNAIAFSSLSHLIRNVVAERVE